MHGWLCGCGRGSCYAHRGTGTSGTRFGFGETAVKLKANVEIFYEGFNYPDDREEFEGFFSVLVANALEDAGWSGFAVTADVRPENDDRANV